MITLDTRNESSHDVTEQLHNISFNQLRLFKIFYVPNVLQISLYIHRRFIQSIIIRFSKQEENEQQLFKASKSSL